MTWDLPKFYLAINALLYIVFGVLCAMRAASSATNLGYVQLSDAGRCEFLVVYAGLQLGLGVFFALSVWWRDSYVPAAVLVALAMYVPIVLIRWSAVIAMQIRTPLTLSVAALETALLIGAIVAWRQVRPLA